MAERKPGPDDDDLVHDRLQRDLAHGRIWPKLLLSSLVGIVVGGGVIIQLLTR